MQQRRFGIQRALLLKARRRTPEKAEFAQLCNRVLKTHESPEGCVTNFPLSLCHCRYQILISLKQLLIPTHDSTLVHLTEILLLLPELRFSGRKTSQLLRFHVLAALVCSVEADHGELISWLRQTPSGWTEKQMGVWKCFWINLLWCLWEFLSILSKSADEGICSWWVWDWRRYTVFHKDLIHSWKFPQQSPFKIKYCP